MKIYQAISEREAKTFTTEQLRENFLIESIFKTNEVHFVYTHYDRVMVGGATPTTVALSLQTYDNLKSDYFLERREIGIINVGGNGTIEVDGESFNLSKLDALYIGKGVKEVVFKSDDAGSPAQFFLLSAPAHQKFPTQKMGKEEASPVSLGTVETANERTIYKYIHRDGIQSCQVVMGLTVLKTGSVWNTMPAHVHDRRMEAYLYFDLNPEHRVFHFMGQPQETRHMLVANHQAILSPPWSIHSGAGTSNYSFIWAMAGENLDFTDMDFVKISDLK
ncbi:MULTISPECIES: 5-dehydro-4-deoxy-D-glucuronate isomerase [unclassified Arcicella]|uniref:5-dehydro-4-deoxy-D-glucuronate isomerase n=1 Tax=unclassified Arcicella TaxID=2644986 RepID=UPI00285C128D|nr:MULTISPECIES: 5-dehydro-4-deoxy-D-glucuronate isomerase [unclassified Arcicella]MDR6564481.1 4-deoxy-L-threo-5-hexosulose-uronate ketol-isomerase [Arcicella sp. BE51]MDR6814340.1 4-deoxy-L-threo-5-hexosulose-uronate ketol-isomerase [Arcicella sp. BE140]MDR6825638.1 4-deoxy-L-threo-5-hexosulose-uronate ketol-isomerase [Arcicella sp. BE139]